MRRLVDHVVAAGADAAVVLGSTGEFSVVPPQFRADIIRAAVEAAAGRIPILVGCGRPSIVETAAEIGEAAACGAHAALVTPSYYFPLADDEIAVFFRAVAKGAPIPLLYYHYPDMTGCRVGVATLTQLVEDGVIFGLKDSSGDAGFLARLAAALGGRDDFRLFLGGSAYLLAALGLGIDGVTGGLGNFATHMDRAVIEAFRAGDMARAQRGQAAIARANDATFFAVPRNAAATAKVVLAALGVCGEATFPPVAGLTPSERERVVNRLPELGLRVSA
jgi:4-hydroxy-tetrahydrodipicolinate synthase